MTTLTDLYGLVRSQTETEASELSNDRINDFLAEAFNRTISAENQWPFYESTWTLTQAIGETTLTLESNVNQPGIISLFDVTNSRRLQMIDYSAAEDWYFGTAGALIGEPIHYSLWGGEIQLWPLYTFDETRDYQLRGFRYPVEWSTLGPASEPDCDHRLHRPLVHYASALAYAQQEDEVLEADYMGRWQRDVEMAREAIMEPTRHRPVVFGPSYVNSVGYPFYRNFSINTP